MCFKNGRGQQSCELLTPAETSLRIPASDLFFANAGGKGYYRTAYPAEVYDNIVAHVETDL